MTNIITYIQWTGIKYIENKRTKMMSNIGTCSMQLHTESHNNRLSKLNHKKKRIGRFSTLKFLFMKFIVFFPSKFYDFLLSAMNFRSSFFFSWAPNTKTIFYSLPLSSLSILSLSSVLHYQWWFLQVPRARIQPTINKTFCVLYLFLQIRKYAPSS